MGNFSRFLYLEQMSLLRGKQAEGCSRNIADNNMLLNKVKSVMSTEFLIAVRSAGEE